MSEWFDGCVMLAPRHEWQDIVDHLFGQLDLLDPTQRVLARRLHGKSHDQDMLDKQGRIIVPEFIRKLAQIESTVMVVGARNYLELWNPDRYVEVTEKEEVSSLGNRITEKRAR